MARFDASYSGIGEMLNAPFMEEAMTERAEKGADYARSIAPRLTERFAESFRVEHGKRGGRRRDRAFGRIVNDDPAAVSIEFGTKDTDPHRTLRRTLDELGA